VRDVLSGAVAESACGRELQGSSLAMEELAGVTAMEAKVAEVTVRFTQDSRCPACFLALLPPGERVSICLGELGDGVGSLIQKNGDGVIRLVEDREILRADETEIGGNESDRRLADGELLRWNRGANSARIASETRAAEAAGE